MLRKTLLFKIIVTALFWAAPLSFLPPSFFRFMGIPYQGTYLFIRLLGVAYWGLVAGYAWGLSQERKGADTDGVTIMGLVSNGGALVVLLGYFLPGRFAAWGILAQIYLMASMTVLALISALLAINLVRSRRRPR